MFNNEIVSLLNIPSSYSSYASSSNSLVQSKNKIRKGYKHYMKLLNNVRKDFDSRKNRCHKGVDN